MSPRRLRGNLLATTEVRSPSRRRHVPRYIVERSFSVGFELPPGQEGVDACRAIVARNEDPGVTWVQSYVRDDRRAMFCVYDAPNPEAIRRAGERNGLPVDRITRVTVLDPYFYTPSEHT